MNPRTIAAMAISVVIIMVWPSIEKHFFPSVYEAKYKKNLSSSQVDESLEPTAQSPSSVENYPNSSSVVTSLPVNENAVVAPLEGASLTQEFPVLDNGSLRVVLNNRGASVKSIELPAFLTKEEKKMKCYSSLLVISPILCYWSLKVLSQIYFI